jgi:hypothetical protein
MDVSNNSTEVGRGIVLVGSLWTSIEKLKKPIDDLNNRDIIEARDVMILAAHRLGWLETVVTGLRYQTQHDAAMYAKFVDKKRDIETMDLDELRVLLRER